MKRLGLLANPASVDARLIHTAERLMSRGCSIRALFSPQHGFTAHAQANMVETPHSPTSRYGVPVYSLYSSTRRPTPEMLEGVELMVVDLQDVGTRGYTFVWTLLCVMEACAEAGIPVRVLDRPNPINGFDVEGPILSPDFFSFVGGHEIPIRHGLTIGELALMMKAEKGLRLDLTVVRVRGWRRRLFFAETKRPWVMPSPNMPSPDTALVYPGMELLEGTNLSEGRGTTRPFELFGAPFIDGEEICAALNGMRLPGVRFRPVSFEPVFDKWKGRLCNGGQIHVTDAKAFRPVLTAAAVLLVIASRHHDDFSFIPPPYEYERVKMPFDILSGSTRLREGIVSGASLGSLAADWRRECAAFRKRCRPFMLYP